MKVFSRMCVTLCAIAGGASLLARDVAPRQHPERDWKGILTRITWVAYSPPSADPATGKEATKGEIEQDLAVLRKAKFNGLVTYSASGLLGKDLPELAKAAGFEALIVGIWDPTDKDELAAAKRAGKSSVVLGFCVGNEGFKPGASGRYRLDQLASAMRDLREATSKPVTTSEEIDDYGSEELLTLGDWVFPNAHPYFHDRTAPDAAVRWTQGAFEDLSRRTKKPVVFKEVGLPTAGDAAGTLSEAVQSQYYVELAKTPVRFVYFEAFDQPWKTHLPVEPHWGIFCADRTPKILGRQLIGLKPPPAAGEKKPAFFVYLDADAAGNRFKPTGLMGDCGDIHIDEACELTPHSGTTCIKVTYDAKGGGPHSCDYTPPCKWAGTYWQHPPNNWGKEERFRGKGFDLSGYQRLSFWARSEKNVRIEFKVGGIDEVYGDSLKYPRSKTANLTPEWQEFSVDLVGANLTCIIGGFCWVSNWDVTPEGAVFYLDDLRYEP